jgi:transposase
MKKDGRKLSHEVNEYLRLEAMRRIKAGESPRSVIDGIGMCRTSIYRWIRAYKLGGVAALKARKHAGRKPKLSDKQKRAVRKWICGKDPRQHGFDFGLWTRSIVRQMIRDKFGIRLSLATVGSVLAELQITPQKPLRRAYERDPKAIEKWKSETYPGLKKRARAIGADIFFLDEAGLRSDAPLQRTWGAKGQTPIVHTSGQRQAINAISAVNELGAFWYAVYTGKFNATLFKEFLSDFMRYRRRPVFLVLDGHPSHKAKMISNYIQELHGKLELHFLPTYAPELNPDEFVWNNLRQNGTSKSPLKKNESLRDRVAFDLDSIFNDKHLVRSFFRAPSVAYIID